MSTPLRQEHFGPYKLVRTLGNAHGATRYAVLCSRTDTNYMLYRFEHITNVKERRALFNALLKMSTLKHAHLLNIESVSYDDNGRLCVVTPYTGNHDGLVTLDQLLNIRDGKLGEVESTRALGHLLDAIRLAHKHEIYNGQINPDDILVDRYGCLQIQLYGFETIAHRSINQAPTQSERAMLITDEIRSVVDLAYTMMTGLKATDDRIAPSRVIKKLDKNWDTWFDIGLDPIDGFDNIEHAINALPTNPNCAQWLTTKSPRMPQVHIGSMLRRFRTSPSTSRPQR
tara:strand:- start:86710 stop:87564 length:855 start_codon:yes stop_codon:yes gene_type:complete